MLTYFLALTLACLISLCLTPLVRSGARWAGVLDVPDGRRKRHAYPIPKLGGVALFLSFYACVWLAPGLVEVEHAHEVAQIAWALFLPSLVILALGVADDLRPTGPWVKIAVQLVAGLLIFYQLDIGGAGITGPLASSELRILSLPATLLWVVLVTNAFNIVDGIDGLAAGVAFIALICLFLMSLATGNLALAYVAAPLAVRYSASSGTTSIPRPCFSGIREVSCSASNWRCSRSSPRRTARLLLSRLPVF